MATEHGTVTPRGFARVAVLVLFVVAVAFLIPLLVGDFSGGRLVVVALLEVPCIAAVAVSALLLARRYRDRGVELWEQSRRDELTGVGNYRALHERLAEEIARHTRHGREFALILIDLDRFKQVNERFGHLEGDRVLAHVGKVLNEAVRADDLVFRQGGDEFAVLAPETGSGEAAEIAARVQLQLRERGDGVRSVEARTGTAVFPGDGRSGEGLLSFADVQLFGAKQEARAQEEALGESPEKDTA